MYLRFLVNLRCLGIFTPVITRNNNKSITGHAVVFECFV